MVQKSIKDKNKEIPTTLNNRPTYAIIIRNNSGVDSGEIDFEFSWHIVHNLDDADKQDICNTAFRMYEEICNATGKQSTIKRKEKQDYSWYSCKEVLPRGVNHVVLAVTLDVINDYSYPYTFEEAVHIAYYADGLWYDEHSSEILYDVTHWTEIPKINDAN